MLTPSFENSQSFPKILKKSSFILKANLANAPLAASITINELWYIALFVVSRSIKKLFSIDYTVSIFIFSQKFFYKFCPVENMGLTHITYIVFH